MKLKPPKLHDKFYRHSFKIKRVAQEFLRDYLPLHLAKRIDLDKLKLRPNSYLDNKLRENITDILYETTVDERACLILFLVEHQSRPEYWMPLRVLKYQCRVWEEHAKNAKNKKLPVIMPIVVYNGQVPYPYETSFFDLLDGPDDIIQNQFTSNFQLVDLNSIEDKKLREATWANVALFVMKHIRSRELVHHLESIANNILMIEESGAYGFTEALFWYIMCKSDYLVRGELEAFIRKILSSSKGDNVMTLVEQYWADGVQEGMQQGMEKGMELRDNDLIIKMLKLGYSIEEICKLTDKKVDTVEAIALAIQ